MPDIAPSDRTDGVLLIGRSAESAVLRSFVERALARDDVLLMTGEPGVGKSVLLETAARHAEASGATVLRGAGVEFEAEVGFAGLHQLLLPLLDDVDALAEPHRRALDVALGLGSGSPLPPLLVSAAVLALVRSGAQSRPVLIVVDDLPWLDRSSVRVLGFVARRVHRSRVGFLAAARTGSDSVLLRAGLPQLEVPPLDEDAAADLLQARFPVLDPRIRQRVLSASAGNPLALLELPAVMTEAQRTGTAPLPPALPLSRHLRQVFVQQLADLPAATRRLLLLASLEGTGDLRTLRAAAADDKWLDDLAPAERARLVRIDLGGQRVVLRHPLIGSAAVEISTSGEIRRAHGALAHVLVDRPEECARHLAEAVVGSDAPAADLLETAAHRARRRGDAVRAVRALLQAAGLTPTGPDRARRLAAAAFVAADTTGELRTVPRLLCEARTADPGTAGSLEVAVASAHHLLNGEGDVESAHLILVRAVEHAVDHGSPADAVEDALYSLVMVCHLGGRDELWRPLERALAALGRDVPPVLSVSSSLFADPIRATATVLERLDELIASVDAALDPTFVVRVGMAASYADRLGNCRRALGRVVRDGRQGGAAAAAVKALVLLCHEALDAGRWDEAVRTAEEGIAWGDELGYGLITRFGVYCSALVAAARGDDETVRVLSDDLLAWSLPRGIHLFEDFAHHVRGLAALGRGDFEEAYRQLTAVGPVGGRTPSAPVTPRLVMDVVEAAVRTGRSAEAAAHVAAMSRARVFTGRPRLGVLLAGSAAVVASGEEAAERFERALAVPGAERYPFEYARVQLAYGEHLRRTRATNAARVQLTAALETFRDLGTRPWADRAWNELRATGLTHRASPAERGAVALTSQEHQIAMLAASGLSNKQIGSRLYLSPRTVGAHLYRVFPKLGISSRAALRDALSGTAPATVEMPPSAVAR
ncbi:AAA family ATPase [Geodermatophilus sp. SYSU D00705]